MKECGIFRRRGQNILWLLLHILRSQDPSPSRIYAPDCLLTTADCQNCAVIIKRRNCIWQDFEKTARKTVAGPSIRRSLPPVIQDPSLSSLWFRRLLKSCLDNDRSDSALEVAPENVLTYLLIYLRTDGQMNGFAKVIALCIHMHADGR